MPAGDPERRAKRGQPVRIAAETFNTQLAMLRDWRDRRHDIRRPPRPSRPQESRPFELKTEIDSNDRAVAWDLGHEEDEEHEFTVHLGPEFVQESKHFWPRSALARARWDTGDTDFLPGARGVAFLHEGDWHCRDLAIPITLGKVQTRTTNFGGSGDNEATERCNVKRCTATGTEVGDEIEIWLEPWHLGGDAAPSPRPGLSPAVFGGDILMLTPFRRQVQAAGEVGWCPVTPPLDCARFSVRAWYDGTANVPRGWHLCDGDNGTPDLRGRVPAGVGGKVPSRGATYGEDEHQHSAHISATGEGFVDGSRLTDHASSWQPTLAVHWIMRTH